MEVLEKVLGEIARHKMIEPGQLVIVGVSGGPDSVALLHILNSLKARLGISLHAAHLNHMFRGAESKEDASFVKKLCCQWGIPHTLEERDVPAYIKETHLSASVAAREVRYQFFYDVLQRTGGDGLALAHHANDQAESILMNILRGSGLKGLSGIAPVRDDIFIRPLISTTRREIENYCKSFNIDYRIDSSNLKSVYRRNKIRHQLIPLLEKEYSPGLVMILNRMAEQVSSEDQYLEELAQRAFGEVLLARDTKELVIDRQRLAEQPVALARRVIRIAWSVIRGTKLDLPFQHVDGIMKRLGNGGSEIVLELHAGIKVRLDYKTLTFISGGVETKPEHEFYDLPVPGSVVVDAKCILSSRIVAREELNVNPRDFPPNEVAIDLAKIKLPLGIRFRQEGDVMMPFGLGKTVKLKKLLIDRKISRHERDSIPLVVEKENDRIIWAAGIRMADEIGITDETKKVLLLCLENGNSSNT